MTLPPDAVRCPGEGSLEEGQWTWREGCETCLRRTAPGGRRWMMPPPIVAFWCEGLIES